MNKSNYIWHNYRGSEPQVQHSKLEEAQKHTTKTWVKTRGQHDHSGVGSNGHDWLKVSGSLALPIASCPYSSSMIIALGLVPCELGVPITSIVSSSLHRS